MKTQQVKPLPDTPAVIVNVFIKEEHHYHKGAVHLDFHDHFMAHLVSKLKFYLHISKKYCTFGRWGRCGEEDTKNNALRERCSSYNIAVVMSSASARLSF